MSGRAILEVETPVLSPSTVTELHLESFFCAGPNGDPRLFLQTSPEYAMKRLLAAGSGAIYQIARVFRAGEQGRQHHPEFTLLEWYRPGYDHHRLMAEVDALMCTLGLPAGETITYHDLFVEHTAHDPQRSDIATLQALADEYGLSSLPAERSVLLEFIMSHIAPRLGHDRPLFVYDYPPCQSALATVREGTPSVAERFELFIRGLEIANGFHELTDADEQRRRFEDDLARRRRAGVVSDLPLDERLLDALAHGLPPSAGVAVGLDRVLMVLYGAQDIHDILAFPLDKANGHGRF